MSEMWAYDPNGTIERSIQDVLSNFAAALEVGQKRWPILDDAIDFWDVVIDVLHLFLRISDALLTLFIEDLLSMPDALQKCERKSLFFSLEFLLE